MHLPVGRDRDFIPLPVVKRTFKKNDRALQTGRRNSRNATDRSGSGKNYHCISFRSAPRFHRQTEIKRTAPVRGCAEAFPDFPSRFTTLRMTIFHDLFLFYYFLFSLSSRIAFSQALFRTGERPLSTFRTSSNLAMASAFISRAARLSAWRRHVLY